MDADLALVLACGLAGVAASTIFDVFGFLLLIVSPTLAMLLGFALVGTFNLSWWCYPASWIVQQAGYLFAMMLVRPAAYRMVLDRVRLMVRRLADI